MDTDLGQRVLKALRAASATSRHAVWLGASPSADLVFVVRASSVPGADLDLMASSCASVPGVRDVRYEIDCGDRAVRVVVTPNKKHSSAQETLPGMKMAVTVALEVALAAWAAARLANPYYYYYYN